MNPASKLDQLQLAHSVMLIEGTPKRSLQNKTAFEQLKSKLVKRQVLARSTPKTILTPSKVFDSGLTPSGIFGCERGRSSSKEP